MAITNIRQQVMQDFRDKVTLEPKLGRKLTKINKDIVQKFRQSELKGEVFRVEEFKPELEDALAEHYKDVADKFDSRIDDRAPKDVGLTTGEKELLTLTLLAFINVRATRQADTISDTTSGEINVIRNFVENEIFDRVERAVTSASMLERRLMARVGMIASLETQAMAEAAKLAEFDVFAKKDPLSLQRPSAEMFKEWVTVGDERVRAAHAAADAQVVPVESLFNVGGQQLRFPGDTAFGATAGNVINCRCSAVYDTAAVFAIRRRVGVAPITETVPSEALVTSLGG